MLATRQLGPPAGAPPDPAEQIEQLEAQLRQLSASLADRVAGAQAETLEHLVLFEAGVQQLEASARQVAAQRSELLAAAKRLALELRGLDLLERHVQSIDELVRRLEAAAAEVLGSGAAAAAAKAAAALGGGTAPAAAAARAAPGTAGREQG